MKNKILVMIAAIFLVCGLSYCTFHESEPSTENGKKVVIENNESVEGKNKTNDKEQAIEDTKTTNTTNTSKEPQNKTENNVSNLTIGQKNAIKKAKDYLNFTAFSRTGLIEQLEYEGFTHEEAVYAVDNIGTNWKEQAVKKAKDYLSFTAFSRTGLIEQLEYEGFTYDQAVYGIENISVNWKEQAAKKAKDYLNFTAFSRTGLIEQLEYEGFTYDQAVYGAEANGY